MKPKAYMIKVGQMFSWWGITYRRMSDPANRCPSAIRVRNLTTGEVKFFPSSYAVKLVQPQPSLK